MVVNSIKFIIRMRINEVALFSIIYLGLSEIIG